MRFPLWRLLRLIVTVTAILVLILGAHRYYAQHIAVRPNGCLKYAQSWGTQRVVDLDTGLWFGAPLHATPDYADSTFPQHVSLDGYWAISVERYGGDLYRLVVKSVLGISRRIVEDDVLFDRDDVQWSPNSRWFSYQLRMGFDSQIGLMGFDSSHRLVRLSLPANDIEGWGDWSPDSRYLIGYKNNPTPPYKSHASIYH
jgi:hypothetical protein